MLEIIRNLCAELTDCSDEGDWSSDIEHLTLAVVMYFGLCKFAMMLLG